jgi:hypothetical protein
VKPQGKTGLRAALSGSQTLFSCQQRETWLQLRIPELLDIKQSSDESWFKLGGGLMSAWRFKIIAAFVLGSWLSGCVTTVMHEGGCVEREDVPETREPSKVGFFIDEVVSPRDYQAFVQLETFLVDMDFEEGSVLEEVFDYLRETGQIQILVSWTTLEDEAFIARDEPLPEIRLKQVSLRTAIGAVLAGVSSMDADLGYEVIDGVVWVSTREDLSRETVVRLHDCSELLSLERPEIGRRELLEYAVELAERLGGERVTNDQDLMRLIVEDLEEGRWQRAEELEDLVKYTIAPETWEPDGVVGSALIWGDVMVVRHTRQVQREVAALLDGLRNKARRP